MDEVRHMSINNHNLPHSQEKIPYLFSPPIPTVFELVRSDFCLSEETRQLTNKVRQTTREVCQTAAQTRQTAIELRQTAQKLRCVAKELRQTRIRQRERPRGNGNGQTPPLNNNDCILQLPQRVASATTIKEFASVISEANLTLDHQEWSRFVAECRRLKNESEQRGDALWAKKE
jgi:hypothetical protein